MSARCAQACRGTRWGSSVRQGLPACGAGEEQGTGQACLLAGRVGRATPATPRLAWRPFRPQSNAPMRPTPPPRPTPAYTRRPRPSCPLNVACAVHIGCLRRESVATTLILSRGCRRGTQRTQSGVGCASGDRAWAGLGPGFGMPGATLRVAASLRRAQSLSRRAHLPRAHHHSVFGSEVPPQPSLRDTRVQGARPGAARRRA